MFPCFVVENAALLESRVDKDVKTSSRRIGFISQVPWFPLVYAPTAEDPFCVYTILQEPFP